MSQMQVEVPLRFSGYHKKKIGEPNRRITEVGPGTAGGEYQRRFWQPVAYVDELGKTPTRIRALGEDLVVFRDGGGRVGCLTLHCCHRNTSLEFGIIEQEGIRCCYHGRLYDVDGTLIEVPGEANAEAMKKRVSQGAYPTTVFEGLVFIYMGPPDRVPVFPTLDRMSLPSVKIVPGVRFEWECNWLQIKENSLDPYHTHVLHMIPQMRGAEKQFADEFGHAPFFTWTNTPGGVMYLGVRRVGDNVWVRSSETYGANLHLISSIFESGRDRKPASPPFLSMWTLPVDDENSVTFYLSHIVDGDPMPFERRRQLEMFGQNGQRSYAERQWIPGDYDAMVSQGAVNPHELENLGSQDRGIALFRRYIRDGIEAVADGRDPNGFYTKATEIAPTFANDYVGALSEIDGNPDDPDAQKRFADKLARQYFAHPPMLALKEFLANR
ncbi:MAG: Rieske 2Fe-2S domain-containing protein [Xanthobacteraceae bacterium]|nr:Rieske 2Fe-2S domain-containing protein [Xanthobacteraceae bacterium]